MKIFLFCDQFLSRIGVFGFAATKISKTSLSKRWPQLQPFKPNDDQTFTNTPPEGTTFLNLNNPSPFHSGAVLPLAAPLYPPQGTRLHHTHRPPSRLVQTPHLHRPSPTQPRHPRPPPMAYHHNPALVRGNPRVVTKPDFQRLPNVLHRSRHMEILRFDRDPPRPHFPPRLSPHRHHVAVASLVLP